MNNQNILGIDLPQLELSNFIIEDSNKFDINRYFRTLGDITVTIKDENTKTQIFHKYVTSRKERNPKFEKAYNDFFNSAFDTTFFCEVKKAFRIGEFYSTQEVKAKLKTLYNHEFAPDEFYSATPKMIDLKKNGWFETKYGKFDGVNGIWIVGLNI
ncbi:MAG: hypothetical protein EOP00_29210 [Pedobacter sp.]|nr:MAG: hypothetical protein EOP00_29210 [Pedobacter sp.]